MPQRIPPGALKHKPRAGGGREDAFPGADSPLAARQHLATQQLWAAGVLPRWSPDLPSPKWLKLLLKSFYNYNTEPFLHYQPTSLLVRAQGPKGWN